MKIRRTKIDFSIFILGFILMGLIFAITMKTHPSFAESGDTATAQSTSDQKNYVTIYDHGTAQTLTIRTDAPTVADVLERTNTNIDPADIVEPALTEAVTSTFRINIYRAKPVIVIDGLRQSKIMTAATDPTEVVKAAGIELLEADVVKITTLDNFIETGLPIAYQVVRANTVNFNFYGQMLSIRTAASTVADFFAERNIAPTADDWASLPTTTAIVDGLNLELHRQGISTISVTETIEFTEQYTYDYNQSVGYRNITVPGQVGTKSVTYAVNMQDGQEIAREFVSAIVTAEPVTQQVTLGARSIAMNPLTASKGRNRYTTASGILREETYYDLPMRVVMGNCQGGGYYTVRDDGVKIDKNGFVIIAAHLGRYPRCSVVETSLGLGKVYDTGGFATTNPEQFDIATDWTKRDGI